MGLERFDPEDHNPLQWDGQMVARADGEYYRAADVDALLARIRAAVAAERAAETRHVCATRDDSPVTTGGGPTYHTSRAVTATRAALDALLADGG